MSKLSADGADSLKHCHDMLFYKKMPSSLAYSYFVEEIITSNKN